MATEFEFMSLNEAYKLVIRAGKDWNVTQTEKWLDKSGLIVIVEIIGRGSSRILVRCVDKAGLEDLFRRFKRPRTRFLKFPKKRKPRRRKVYKDYDTLAGADKMLKDGRHSPWSRQELEKKGLTYQPFEGARVFVNMRKLEKILKVRSWPLPMSPPDLAKCKHYGKCDDDGKPYANQDGSPFTPNRENCEACGDKDECTIRMDI